MNTFRIAVVRFRIAFLVLLAVAMTITWPRDGAAQQTYDAYGYDYQARVFSGLYENADRDSNNNSGDPTRLHMEWDQSYNVAAPELSSLGASVMHFQSGTYVGSDGQTYRWSYSIRLRYTGPGSPLGNYFSPEDEGYLDAGNSSTPQARPIVLPTAQQ